MYDLSILIPARNEMFLKRTIEDLLENIEGKTEIIVVLDGALADPPIPQHERLTVIYHPVSVGQRAATNEAARIAQGKYLMKVDAHCAFDKGFDVKMMKDMQDDWTMVPVMKNLHVFNWICPDGHRRYQGGEGVCTECGKPTEREIVWIPKKSPNSKSYCFDSSPHFQYFKDFNKRPEGKGELTESMSLQGSCFMLTKERYFALNICDESLGSWGSQGIEVACKTWLSGGKVMCNHKTWYAHLFRTQPGFSFPYQQSGKQIQKAKGNVLRKFIIGKWEHQKYPLSWLIEKFSPIPGWSQQDIDALKLQEKAKKKPTKGVVYYTHNKCDPHIFQECQKQLKNGIKEKHIVTVSSKPLYFGAENIVISEEGYLDIFKKILVGLEASTADVIFFAEHDVLYHPTHFNFIPPRKDAFYYNTNVWKLRADGHSLYVDDCKQLSGLCAWREVLIDHFKERVRRVEIEGFTRKNGFEPGTRKIKNGGYDDREALSYKSEYPNVDIRHETNATKNRWTKEEFRNPKFTEGWMEAENFVVPGWTDLKEIYK